MFYYFGIFMRRRQSSKGIALRGRLDSINSCADQPLIYVARQQNSYGRSTAAFFRPSFPLVGLAAEISVRGFQLAGDFRRFNVRRQSVLNAVLLSRFY